MSEYHDDEFNSFENQQSIKEISEQDFDGNSCDVDFIENHEENSFNDNFSAIEKKIKEESNPLQKEPNDKSFVPDKKDDENFNFNDYPSEISSTLNICEMFVENINYKYKYRFNTNNKSIYNENDSCHIKQEDIPENENISLTKGILLI
jgi:hypothetical protein